MEKVWAYGILVLVALIGCGVSAEPYERVEGEVREGVPRIWDCGTCLNSDGDKQGFGGEHCWDLNRRAEGFEQQWAESEGCADPGCCDPCVPTDRACDDDDAIVLSMDPEPCTSTPRFDELTWTCGCNREDGPYGYCTCAEEDPSERVSRMRSDDTCGACMSTEGGGCDAVGWRKL